MSFLCWEHRTSIITFIAGRYFTERVREWNKTIKKPTEPLHLRRGERFLWPALLTQKRRPTDDANKRSTATIAAGRSAVNEIGFLCQLKQTVAASLRETGHFWSEAANNRNRFSLECERLSWNNWNCFLKNEVFVMFRLFVFRSLKL